jgi:hypothetical protein
MRRARRREKARAYKDPVVGRIVNHSTVLFAMGPAFGLLMADRRSSRAGPSLERFRCPHPIFGSVQLPSNLRAE